MTEPTRFLRKDEVLSRTGLQKSAIYQKIKDGTFPRPVKIGPRAVAWIEAEVAEWQAARIRTGSPNAAEAARIAKRKEAARAAAETRKIAAHPATPGAE